MRISATPERPSDGPRLASEVLEAVAAQTAARRPAQPRLITAGALPQDTCQVP